MEKGFYSFLQMAISIDFALYLFAVVKTLLNSYKIFIDNCKIFDYSKAISIIRKRITYLRITSNRIRWNFELFKKMHVLFDINNLFCINWYISSNRTFKCLALQLCDSFSLNALAIFLFCLAGVGLSNNPKATIFSVKYHKWQQNYFIFDCGIFHLYHCKNIGPLKRQILKWCFAGWRNVVPNFYAFIYKKYRNIPQTLLSQRKFI